MSTPAVVVDSVSKRFRLYHERNQSLKAAVMRRGRATYEDFWALRDVSFEIPAGTTFGLMGRNGSGKSTLLKCIAQIYGTDAGSIRSNGSIAALLELGSGFHPELSGRENIFLNAAILGLSKQEVTSKFDEIVDFSGVERFIDQPVKNYSSGMYVRLGFAVAINVEPDILLVDEVLAVGDAAFQEKCMLKFAEYRRSGRTVVVVSHDMGSMRTFCDQVAWLEDGQLSATGQAEKIIDTYVDGAHAVRYEQHGGERFGTGDISVTSVEVVADGQSVDSVRTGDSVTLRMSYQAVRDVIEPVFGLSVETLEGFTLWVSHSLNDHVALDVAEGSGVVDFHIPALMLQPGTYDISASITDSDQIEFYDMYRHCTRFDVLRGPWRDSRGVLSMGGAWHVKDQAVRG